MKERTRLPTSKFHPSISTKNNILNGSETTVGGSIIIPIAMVMVATMRSMTRKGSTMRKPISKPRRISEIMKAGTSTRRSTVSRSTVSAAFAGEIGEEVEVLVAHVSDHEGAERIGDAFESLGLADLVVHQRPHAVVPGLIEGRRHDVEGHEQRKTDDDEVGGGGLQANAGTQDREGDDEACVKLVTMMREAGRIATKRKAAEKRLAFAEERLRYLCNFSGVCQMMPLLIAVAIAIARLLADSFWIAWVT